MTNRNASLSRRPIIKTIEGGVKEKTMGTLSSGDTNHTQAKFFSFKKTLTHRGLRAISRAISDLGDLGERSRFDSSYDGFFCL